MSRYDNPGAIVYVNAEGLKPKGTEQCPTCERHVPRQRMTKHHLKTRKADKYDTELMCRECHSYVHRLFTNKELADPASPLNTVEGLLANPEYAKAVAWIRKQDPRKHPKIHTSNRKRGRRKR